MDFDKAPRLFRLWYYIRLGFGEYFNLIFSILNTIILIHAFVISTISNIPTFLASFSGFLVVGILVIVPVAIILGWLHFKGMPAFKAEADLMVEANPYVYKVPPGWQKEFQLPWYRFIARAYSILLEKEGLLGDEERQVLSELLQNLDTLERGGIVS